MTRDEGRGVRDEGAGTERPAGSTSASPALRCPRCGTWLGGRASAALAARRRAEAEGRLVAVSDDAPFCGCCGLLVATPVAAADGTDTAAER